MPIVNAMAASFRKDLLCAAHCFLPNTSKTGTSVTSSQIVTSVSSVAGLAVGMRVTGGGFPVDTVLAGIDSVASQIFLSKPCTSGITGGTLSFLGDVFKIALIRPSMTGTYDANTTSYNTVTTNSDEVSGTGYVAGGFTLTQIAPTSADGRGYLSFDDPVWIGAAFSFAGAILYNSSGRIGEPNKSIATFAFAGTQTVDENGTATLRMPAFGPSTAVIKI